MDELKRHLQSFTVLVAADDPSAVRVIPGAQSDVLVELSLEKYGILSAAQPAGLIGNRLTLHFDRAKARELATQILAQIGKEE